MGDNPLHTIVLMTHVLSATILVGVAFVSFIIELKKFTTKETLTLTELIWKVAGPLMGLQILTGIYLAGSEWDKIGSQPYFWIKMVLFFGIGGLVGFINNRRFKLLKDGKQKDWGQTPWGLIGLLTFLTVAALGVLLAENAA